MSRGEAKDTGRARQVILANCIEAVLGAMYLDAGYQTTTNFIAREILVELSKIIAGGNLCGPQIQICRKWSRKSGDYPDLRRGLRNRP